MTENKLANSVQMTKNIGRFCIQDLELLAMMKMTVINSERTKKLYPTLDI